MLGRSLTGVCLAGLLAAAPGCVFDTSGRAQDPDNTNNTSNSNNVNQGNNNNTSGVCGDGVIEGGEGCDDGNTAANDGCDDYCQPEPGWVCTGTPSVCAMTCGNGALDPGETCDDGNTDSDDGCNGQCQEEPGWDCTILPCEPQCGDSLVVGPEGCDDGNLTGGDGCAADCTVEPFFACDNEPSLCHCVIYVDHASVPDPRTGGSWSEALATVQQGIGVASGGCEVWVADGVYHIWQGSDDDTVALKTNVSVYGGFAGTETAFNQRNWLQNATILSGFNGGQNERVFHVVTADSVSGAVLNGFTVTGGDAKWGKTGGGIRVNSASVTLSQLRVADNQADTSGGGIYAYSSTVNLTRSVITGNYANDGGGMDLVRQTQLTASRCRFTTNSARFHGGGLRVYDYSTADVSSSLFVDNAADEISGGAIMNFSQTELTVTNCTIFRNSADDNAGAIYNLSASFCAVRNSILWGNTPGAFNDIGTTVSMSHTIMQDSGWAGTNQNLSMDPLLSLPSFVLDPASPAIDTADDAYAPNLGLGGNIPVDIAGVGTPGTLADRGCFEYQP